MSERLCEGCGSTLPPMRSQGNPRIWCSRSCESATKRERRGLPTRRSMQSSTCKHCGDQFSPTTSRQKFCSGECGWRFRQASKLPGPGTRQPREIDCYQCGEPAGETLAPKKLCGGCRSDSRNAHYRRKNNDRRSARKVGIRYTLNEIGDRDGWRCHLCAKAVDRTKPGTVKWGPTIDHLIPLSDGGEDTPTNVSLAHRQCNVTRRHEGVAQLRLTG